MSEKLTYDQKYAQAIAGINQKIKEEEYELVGRDPQTGEMREYESPEAFLDASIEEHALQFGFDNESALDIMLQNLNITATEEIVTSLETSLAEIKLNDKNLMFRALVLGAEIKTIYKDSNSFQIASLIVGDGDVHLEVSGLYRRRSYEAMFNAIETGEIVGQTYHFSGFEAKQDKYTEYPFIIRPSRGAITDVGLIPDGDVQVNDTIYADIKDIYREGTTTPVCLRGKVIDLSEIATYAKKWGPSPTGYRRGFNLLGKDGHIIEVTLFDDVAQMEFTEEEIIELIGVRPTITEYSTQKGTSNVTINGKKHLRFVEQSAYDHLYTAEKRALDIPFEIVSSMAHLKSYYVIGQIMNFSSQRISYEDNERSVVLKPPYYLSCNTKDENGKVICMKKTEKEGSYYKCAAGHVQTEDQYKKRFLINADFYDGTFLIRRILIGEEIVEDILGESSSELIAQYDEMQRTYSEQDVAHSDFIQQLNQMVQGRFFKINAVYKLDGRYGFQFSISEAKEISIAEYIDVLQQKIAPKA